MSRLSPQISPQLNERSQVQVGVSKLRMFHRPLRVVRRAVGVGLSAVAPPLVHLSHPQVLVLHRQATGTLLPVVTLQVVLMTHHHQIIKGAPPDQKAQIHNDLFQLIMEVAQKGKIKVKPILINRTWTPLVHLRLKHPSIRD